MEKICVAVRLRPPAPAAAEATGNGNFWKIEENRISLHKPHGTPVSGVSYTFDHVLDQACSNSRVYELLTKDIISAAVEGFNGTVFAYGQTSSGKTFTMNGSDNDPGIIHRAVKAIFDKIEKLPEREFLIRVSYMEIYNEEINDLLVVENQKLQMHESLDRGVFVAGLREEIVSSSNQVLKLLEAGEVNRHFGETNMNVRSSRSHTIFRMVIESKGKETDSSSSYFSSDAIRVSVLNLVDLAGSERIAKTGADGVRLKEGKHINKSLMVLGNVINKLSDGAKQRAHVPYRDSKLTRILQNALGGNAKTSIICTIAPEEIHIEETKGTLQFANRAKRITNCAQVNEILTDAALLKRQKLEIEELREKLQGSRAEVLEQEIFKLRNEMLKYELEREKLAMELEEERKLHKERDQCIKEQQMKIDNLSNLTKALSNQSDVKTSASFTTIRGDEFSTPCFKAAPSAFVARRSDYTSAQDSIPSPPPEISSNVVDEDAWMRLNKGYVADLDSVLMTPAAKVRSLSTGGTVPSFSSSHYEWEVQNLKQQLEIAKKEKQDLEIKLAEQAELNSKLMGTNDELQKELKKFQDIAQVLQNSVTTCKDIYEDIVSVMQSSVVDENAFAAELLGSTGEIGVNLFSTLESSMAVNERASFNGDSLLLQQQCNILAERLSRTMTSLISREGEAEQDGETMRSASIDGYKEIEFVGGSASWKQKLSNELNMIKDEYLRVEHKVDRDAELLEISKAKYQDLEREFGLLKEEREALLNQLSESTQKLVVASEQRDKTLKHFEAENQKRRDLEEEIKQFSIMFASRQRSLACFHNEFKSRIESLRAHNPNAVPNSFGSTFSS